jgi:hypothetical protein
MLCIKKMSNESKRIGGLTRYGTLLVVSSTIVVSLALGILAIVLQRWREGRDSSFLYGVPANATGSMGFATRHYGLLNVVGNRPQSWASLANSACDRFKLYNNTAHLEPIAPVCGSSGNPEVCSGAFLTHLETRCAAYNDLTIVSWATLSLIIIGLALGFGSLSSILFTSLAKWKRFIVAGLTLSGIFLAGSSIGWYIFSTIYFRDIAKTATYPFPEVSVGFFLGVGGGVAALIAAVHLALLAQIVTDAVEHKVGKRGLADFFEQRISIHQEDDVTTQA